MELFFVLTGTLLIIPFNSDSLGEGAGQRVGSKALPRAWPPSYTASPDFAFPKVNWLLQLLKLTLEYFTCHHWVRLRGPWGIVTFNLGIEAGVR